MERDGSVICPFCRGSESRVVDSRATDDGGAIRRRRECRSCGQRFTTTETTALVVLKRSGVREVFDRDKVVRGVRKACQGRPVTEDDLAALGEKVELSLRASGAAEVGAGDVGVAVLEPLRHLDEVAYLRFASVYKDFSSLDDFQAAIDELRTPITSEHVAC